MSMKTAMHVARARRGTAKARARKEREDFPYVKVARMHKRGSSLETIAKAIGRVDKQSRKDRRAGKRADPYHTLRNFLYRMYNKGFTNTQGKHEILERRVEASTVKACRAAGLRAWPKPKRRVSRKVKTATPKVRVKIVAKSAQKPARRAVVAKKIAVQPKPQVVVPVVAAAAPTQAVA